MADKLISLSTFKRALNSLKSKFLPTTGGEVGALTLTDGLKVNNGNVVINNRYGGIYGINSANNPIHILSNVYEATGVGNSTTNLTLHSKVAPKWNDNGKSHNLVTSYNGGIEETLSSIRLINSGTIYGTPGGDVAENEMILLQSYYGQTQLGNDKCQTLIDSSARPKVRINSTNYEMAITDDIPKMIFVSGLVTIDKTTGEGTIDIKLPITNTNYEIIKANFDKVVGQYAPIYFASSSLSFIIANAHVIRIGNNSEYYASVLVKKLTGTMTSNVYTTVDVILLEKK